MGRPRWIGPLIGGVGDMRVGIVTTFLLDRKEPLGALFERLAEAFVPAGLTPPGIGFRFADTPLPGKVSAVGRALRKEPGMAAFETVAPRTVGMPDTGYRARVLTNLEGPGAARPAPPLSSLVALAAGVPRAYPFHAVAFSLASPEFGEPGQTVPGTTLMLTPGLNLSDEWWVGRRPRHLEALHVLPADPSAPTLPEPHPGVAAVLAACGRQAARHLVPLAAPGGTAAGARIADVLPALAERWRERVTGLVATLPHDLPDAATARAATPAGSSPGPLKPALVRAFKPLGYGCRRDHGTFLLTRRSAANTALTVDLDVGTWSNQVSARFEARALAGSVRLPLPVATRALNAPQYPIAGPESWAAIVGNLAHLVAALERDFLPEFEAAAGPSPGWFQP